MVATLHARDLEIALGPVDVLCGVSLSIEPGQRVGVVGPNGVGKSTLLKILAGVLEPDRGHLGRMPPRATVGYLPQEPDRRVDETVLEFLARRTGVSAAAATMEAATRALAAGEPGAEEAYANALEAWLDLGGGDLEARAEKALEELGIGAGIAESATATLSGGQAARVSLASILLSRFDVLLLDEPTNDLDFDGLGRLEEFVTRADASFVIVSHDRAFLERVITDVVELDPHHRTAATYHGGWSAYLESKAVARRHAEEEYATNDEKRSTLRARARRQRSWSAQGVRKAKRDKSERDKTIRSHRIETSEKVASKARATERALERLEVVEKPWQGWQLQFEIAQARRSGELVARFSGAAVHRGGFTLGPVDLVIAWAERLAVVGRNGSGKSTLLELLLQRLPPDEGSCWVGPSVIFGDLEQRRTRFHRAATLLDGFTADSGMLPGEARTLLAKFGLGTDHIGRAVASLSPGERTRASLALFQAHGVNCLVLDEPTNHLDLPAIEQLESALDAYTGTVILVTHDRELLERFSATRVVRLEQGQVVEDDEP